MPWQIRKVGAGLKRRIMLARGPARVVMIRSSRRVMFPKPPSLASLAQRPNTFGPKGKRKQLSRRVGTQHRHHVPALMQYPTKELMSLAREFVTRFHLNLPPNPNTQLFLFGGGGESASWPLDLPVYYITIRSERAQGFLARMQGNSFLREHTHEFRGVHGKHMPKMSGLRAGEIGCSASHRNLWTKLARDPEVKHALICEDDADLTGSPAQVSYLLQLMGEARANNVDLVYCGWFQGYAGHHTPATISAHLKDVFQNYIQLWCIYVTKRGLEKLALAFPASGSGPRDPIDVAVRKIGGGVLKSAVSWPPLCWSVGAQSDTVGLR